MLFVSHTASIKMIHDYFVGSGECIGDHQSMKERITHSKHSSEDVETLTSHEPFFNFSACSTHPLEVVCTVQCMFTQSNICVPSLIKL
jgi:hypothetical protein